MVRAGDARFQFVYGVALSMRLRTDGYCFKNEEESAKYFKLSADQGWAEAQCAYAKCLLRRTGVMPDFGEAARNFKLAADQGLPQARYLYGICLRDGTGVGRDEEEAARYFALAADQWNTHAWLRELPPDELAEHREFINPLA
jgi:TPR repeat protein